MTCPQFRTLPIAVCLVVALRCSAAVGSVPKSESLFPDTTKGYVSVADLGVLRDCFNRTGWGQLVHDPAMQPFVEDLRRQLQQKGVRRLDELGVSWQELEGVPGGEISIALIRQKPGRMAVALTIDVTGHREQAVALLERVANNLLRRGAIRVPRDPRESISVFDLPDEEGKRAGRQTAWFLKGDLLAAADDVETLQRIFAATNSERSDALANFKPFRAIVDRCDKAAAGVAPQIRWFVEPFGYATMVRETTLKERRKGIDLVQALRSQGFTAIQGIGGYLSFGTENSELIHRTMVYAPPLPGHENSEDKFELAARLLKFPSGGNLAPQPWVPSRVATYNTFYWDIKTAFAAVGPLVDEIMAEKGVFHDVIDSLKSDPQGPQVDIEKDLIGNLGNRVTVITDYQLPIGPKSERLLVAIDTTNEAVVAQTIAKTMKGDACRREFEGHEIWEIVDEECVVPDVKIEISGGPAHPVVEEDKHAKDRPLMQNAAVTVAFGHLFVASNLGYLETILHQAGQADGLVKSAEYHVVVDRMKALGARDVSFLLLSRTDEEYRPTYELIRTGQMPRSETVLGQVLNALLGDGKEGIVRKQRIDGSKLPEFQAISHYFGPAGTFVSSEPNGWFICGFMLDKSLVLEPTASKDAVPVRDAASVQPAPIPVSVQIRSAAKAPIAEPVARPAEPTSVVKRSAITGQKLIETTTK